MEKDGRGRPSVAYQELRLCYRSEALKQSYKSGLIWFGKIIVELKAVSALLQGQPF